MRSRTARAAVILGRGPFTESFPLFGFDLRQHDELFNEKLDLFAALLKQAPVTWQGKLRRPLTDQLVFQHGRLKTLIGIGGARITICR